MKKLVFVSILATLSLQASALASTESFVPDRSRVIVGRILRRSPQSITVVEPRSLRRWIIRRSVLHLAQTPHRGDAIIAQLEAKDFREIAH